ncbi:MAG TPA: hypothetical protein VLV78_08325 [Thermoanaerobaculia bacterium]|nr:hypothetical protein [Thermoanaerobaculia bacterium]
MRHRLFFSLVCLVLGATPLISATNITLNVGASSLPEGSYEEIPISTDAPLFTKLDVSVSDPTVLAVPATVTRSFGTTSLRVRFQSVGTATVTLTAPDGGSASAALTVTPGPVLTALGTAPAIVQAANVGGRSATVGFTNSGSQPFSASLSSPIFDLSPASLSLTPGATQSVTFTGKALPAGAYKFDLALPQKRCCPIASQTYTVTLTSLVPSGTAGDVGAGTGHVEIVAPPDAAFAPAIVTFANSGSAAVSGTVTSDVAWLQPLDASLVTIPARGATDVEVALNRDQRPDSFNPLGTEVGTLSFVYANTPAGLSALDSGGSTTSVTISVADTISLSATPASIPALNPGEIALLMPGMGNVLGSVGHFVSDLSLRNRESQRTLSNLRLFFAPNDGAPTFSSTIAKLLPSQAVRFADVTSSFGEGFSGGAGHLGTLQLRFSNVDQLIAAASVFNASNAGGTYGTGIPPLRSDRAIAAGGRMYLTGLRADAGAHTNLYLQEASGGSVSIAIRFFDAAGNVLSQRTEALGSWALRALGGIVPNGAVSADLSHDGGSGSFTGYATPVDNGGDTWVVADWQRYYGVQSSGIWIVPVAGVLHGAADTYFRTDIAIMNTGSSKATGTLRFYNRDGTVSDKSISIEQGQTFVSSDVVTTFFGVTNDTAGFLMFLPAGGSTVMTSRTYSTKANVLGSFGSAAPSLAPAFALHSGERRLITAVEDAKTSAVLAKTPATFRTNFGLVETSGAQTTVRVSLEYIVPGALASAIVAASRDYTLVPNQWLQQSVRDIFGTSAPDNDFHNATLEFTVISGSGSAIPYVSTIDNGTGDSLLRVD